MGRGKSVGNEKWKNKFWPPFSCGFANMAYFEFCGPVRNHVDFFKGFFFAEPPYFCANWHYFVKIGTILCKLALFCANWYKFLLTNITTLLCMRVQ